MVSIGVRGGGYGPSRCLQCEARLRQLCAGLPDELMPALNAISTSLKVSKGETLFLEGDEARHSFNVVNGYLRLARVGIDGRRQVMGFVSTGDFVGHTRKDAYSISAEALTDVTVCRFERGAFEDLLVRFPVFEREFNRMTAGMLDDMQDQLFTLGRKNALERVASFLLSYVERQEEIQCNGHELWLPMTRADIADSLGLTLETVSRAFSRLKNEGILEIEQAHTIRILDREGLEDLASGEAETV